MEAALLSRLCSKELVSALERFIGSGGDIECLRLRAVRNERAGRLRPDVLHLVCSWEGTDGVRASAMRCMCRTLESADYDAG